MSINPRTILGCACVGAFVYAASELLTSPSSSTNLRARRLLQDPRTVVLKSNFANLQNAESQMGALQQQQLTQQNQRGMSSLDAGVSGSLAMNTPQLQDQQLGGSSMQLQVDPSMMQQQTSLSRGVSQLQQQQQQQQQTLGVSSQAEEMNGFSNSLRIDPNSRQQQIQEDGQMMQQGNMMMQQGEMIDQQKMTDPSMEKNGMMSQQQITDPSMEQNGMMSQQQMTDPSMEQNGMMSQQQMTDPSMEQNGMMSQQQMNDPSMQMGGALDSQLLSGQMMQQGRLVDPSSMQQQQGDIGSMGNEQDPYAMSSGSGSQENRQQGNKLEFIHITKTGGSAVEKAAAEHDIMWGACHYMKIKYLGCESPDWDTPKKRRVERMPAGLKYTGEPWHSPPHWLDPNLMEGSDTFVIIRNPYERLVSEYYCSSFGYRGDDREDPKTFNTWLAGNLTLLEEKLQGHFLPQHYYVYDEHGDKVVTHILRYENLQNGFDALMQRYNLPVRMPEKNPKTIFHFKGKDRNARETITVNDISPENIQRINQAYGRDFEYFGYEMITTTPSMSEGQGGTLSPDGSDSVVDPAAPLEGGNNFAGAQQLSMGLDGGNGGNQQMIQGQQIMGQDDSMLAGGQQMMMQDGSNTMLSDTATHRSAQQSDNGLMLGENGGGALGGDQQQLQMMGEQDSQLSSSQQLLSGDRSLGMSSTGGQQLMQQNSMQQQEQGSISNGNSLSGSRMTLSQSAAETDLSAAAAGANNAILGGSMLGSGSTSGGLTNNALLSMQQGGGVSQLQQQQQMMMMQQVGGSSASNQMVSPQQQFSGNALGGMAGGSMGELTSGGGGSMMTLTSGRGGN